MVASLRKTLAENVEKLRAMRQRDTRASVRAFAAGAGLQPMKVGRVLSEKAGATVETVQQLADAFTLQPWQLLVPDFDPLKPPRLAEPAFSPRALELATMYDGLQNRGLADAAAAFFEVAALGGAPEDAGATASPDHAEPSSEPTPRPAKNH